MTRDSSFMTDAHSFVVHNNGARAQTIASTDSSEVMSELSTPNSDLPIMIRSKTQATRKERSTGTLAISRVIKQSQVASFQCFGGWVKDSFHGSRADVKGLRKRNLNPCLRCRVYKIKCTEGVPCDPCAEDLLRQFNAVANGAFHYAPPCVRSSFSEVNSFKATTALTLIVGVMAQEERKFFTDHVSLLFASYRAGKPNPQVLPLANALEDAYGFEHQVDQRIETSSVAFIRVVDSFDALQRAQKLSLILADVRLCALMLMTMGQMYYQLNMLKHCAAAQSDTNPGAREHADRGAVLASMLCYYAAQLVKRISADLNASTTPFLIFVNECLAGGAELPVDSEDKRMLRDTDLMVMDFVSRLVMADRAKLKGTERQEQKSTREIVDVRGKP